MAKAIGFDHLTRLVRRYVEAAGVGKQGLVPPLPAHDGDADARERRRHPLHPGDARPRGALSTTQIYTHVSIRELKEVHTATHPARLERGERAGLDEERRQAQAAAELLAALEKEAATDDES